MTTLRDVFEQSVLKYPNKEALYDVRSNERLTYMEWDKKVNQVAQALINEGVEKGDRVSAVLFNTSEFATAYFACIKIGAVFNPINFRLTSKEIEYILQDAEPKIVLFEKAVKSQITPIADKLKATSLWYIDDDTPEYAKSYHQQIALASHERPNIVLTENDLYAMMYTSGTTGRPKGVLHTHRDMVDQSMIMIGMQRITNRDRGLSVAPMFHCAELHCAFLSRVHIGASQVILHHFEAKKVLELIERERITTFFAAPTMWNMLLQENIASYQLSSLRQGLYGGAPMAPALVKAITERMELQLLQAYGMTEMGPAITFLMEDEQLQKAGSAGKPLINHEIRIVRTNDEDLSEPEAVADVGERGEIIVRGPSMMLGYYNREDATKKAIYKGWYYSGDIGYIDDEGFLWVCDRVDDMIVSGGENIYSKEVEDVLFDHSGVLDVAVVGEPDEHWGQRVVAFVVKKDPKLTEQQLEHFCRLSDKLANYKRPRRYYFVNELPRNASGKLQKYKLRTDTPPFQQG
ncbi:fatty acid--CoA ligase [Halalkalibacterium ligniniphilum]|uniref:fatty acid--CoA ligase n=1 Tax=Halalkalibacterium ligniniphilum TaxID=1134413 RepID=UPI000348876B|nr:fatty acid--CoA ligase [Halalkalibacterium ligniniphilum]